MEFGVIWFDLIKEQNLYGDIGLAVDYWSDIRQEKIKLILCHEWN